MYLVSLGIERAKQILLIADGAEWYGLHIPTLLNRLCCLGKIYYLLDFYHATEHLKSFADAGFKDKKESQAWFKTARSNLKKGQIISLIEQMKQYRKSVRGYRRQILTSQNNYFNKRGSQGLFDSNKISQLNLPIGSGAVESLIRQAVNLRLKSNGKFWLQHNAEIILPARWSVAFR